MQLLIHSPCLFSFFVYIKQSIVYLFLIKIVFLTKKIFLFDINEIILAEINH